MINCANCQTLNPDAARFCMSCGHKLGTGDQEPGSRERESAIGHQASISRSQSPLHQYVPRELLAKLEATRNQGGMVGERRIVTMLFCDVKGSTAAAERLDPEEWAEIINGAFERMIAPVYRYEGTLARLMGDAILAFFGAPIAHEDDPQRAILAGLDILQEIRPYREQMQQRWMVDFSVRVGINTGLVVVGEVGSDLRLEYTALGDAVNLAARMEQMAEPGTVQISKNTYKLVAPLFDFEDLGEVEVKGKSEPVQAYRVLGRKAAPGRLRGLERQGISSPLVGRDDEFAAVKACLSQLEPDQGGIAFIFGEAGLGKSRLVAELRQDVSPEHSLWLEGRTLSFGQTISYWPFQEILWQYTDITEDESEADAWRKLEDRVSALFAGQTAEVLPYLASLLSLEVTPEYLERVQYLDAESLGRQVFLASRRFFERLARSQPLVLVFEDVHWMDDSSARLLEHLLPLVERVPLLIIGLSRPDPDTPGARLRQVALRNHAPRYTEVVLTPLATADSARLVRNLLAIDDLPLPVREMIVRKADGNPFFLEEIIRTLIDTGAVVRDSRSGRWRATARVEGIHIPDTIQGVIMARVDRLDEDLKQVLRTAAVIGRSFLYRVLRTIAKAGSELDRHLSELQGIELIREKKQTPELEYIFKHALAQEATYENILLQKRRELHAQVGQAIEHLFADRLEEFYGLLAYHYARAETWEKAQAYLLKAGDQAGRVAADAEALVHYQQALDAYQRAFGDHWDPVQRATLERKIGEALLRRGEHDQALNYLQQALSYLGRPLPSSRAAIRRALLAEMLRQVGYRLLPNVFRRPIDSARILAVKEEIRLYWAIVWIYVVSDAERFMLAVMRGLNQAERIGDIAGIIDGFIGIQTAADFLGQYWLGDIYIKPAIRLVEGGQPPEAQGIVYQGMIMHASWQGQAQTAIDYGWRAAEAYQQAGDLRGWGASTMLMAETMVYAGDYSQARPLADQLIHTGQEGGDTQVQAWGLSVLGPIQQFTGQLDAAIDTFQRYYEFAEAMPDHISIVEAKTQLARCYLLYGDLEKTLVTLEEARQASQTYNVQGKRFLSRIRNALAAAYVFAAEEVSAAERAHWLEKAQRACRKARKVAKGYRPWLAEAYRLQGTCEWLQGKPAAARKWWQRSLALAEELGQQYDLGLIYLEMGRRLGERPYLERAASLFDQVGAARELVMAQTALSSNRRPDQVGVSPI